MHLDELVGAKLVLGFHGTQATPQIIDMLRETHARSIILFSRNFEAPTQVAGLIRDLSDGVGRPLLVMVDHEGGRVIRFGTGLTQFPDAATVGKTQDVAAIAAQGKTEAEELLELGVGVNLAPVVDVLMEECDAVIGNRSYGSDPDLVSRCAVARIEGLQGNGVGACAKHFPGLGAVPKDPHKVLPTISLEWPAIERLHLPPFRAAIAAGVAMVMSSHVCYPSLGEPAGQPATFSKWLITQLLRQRLKFQGLILTDDLEMGAMSAFGSMGELAIRATEAGHDLLLICSNLEWGLDAFGDLRAAYQSGRLPMNSLLDSASRLDQFRQRFSL